MKYDKTKSHVDRMLALAEKYEKEGNKKMSDYWIEKADKFDKQMQAKNESSKS